MAIIGVNTSRQSVGPSGGQELSYSNAFFVGQTPWGVPNVATLCTSFTDYLRQFGGIADGLASVAGGTTADTYANITDPDVIQTYYGVKSYFAEKGPNSPGVLWFVRSVQTSGPPTRASKTFADATTNNTTVTSKWPGLQGSATQVTITTPSPIRGSGYTQIIVYHPRPNITETWEIANAEDAANASFKSQLVTIALPSGGQLPITAAASKLASGTPATADSYNASDSDLVGTTAADGSRTGLQCFNDFQYAGGLVAIPGKYSSTVRTGINTHCASYYRTALLGPPSALLLNTVTSDIATTGDFVSYYWPQVRVISDQSDTSGVVLIDNVGVVAGLQARLDGEYGGLHKAPAGLRHPFNSVVDVESASDNSELVTDAGVNTLADYNINTIRRKNGAIVGWGLRSRSTDGRYRQLPVGRIVQKVVIELNLRLQRFVFEPYFTRLDVPSLFAEAQAECNAFLSQMHRRGELLGTAPGQTPKRSDAYFVTCSSSNNPDVQLASGVVAVDVAIVPSLSAERIDLRIQVTAPGSINA